MSASDHDHARGGHWPDRGDDRRKAPPRLCRGRGKGAAIRLIALALLTCLSLVLAPATIRADPLRIASYNVELARKGPGLLLRDLHAEDPQAQAVVQVIAEVRPQVLVLQRLDYDHGQLALRRLRDLLALAGVDYPHLFALRPNAGWPSGQDLDGDGRLGGARDAYGYGRFSGQGGMAVLSQFPILPEGVKDHSTLLWSELPASALRQTPDLVDRALWPHLRLSSVGHWVVPLRIGGRRLDLWTFHAGTPLFDGPEDRNGFRNADEIRLWRHYLDGALGTRSTAPFVLLGDANLDPQRGSGQRSALRELLADTRLQDALPRSTGHGANTVDWGRAGEMRVSYVLPAAELQLRGSGVFWPSDGEWLAEAARRASRHRLIWVDIDWPGETGRSGATE